ncbi:MAG: hypothetical protein COA99_14370, partial [Moraxellaceae bacterium]
ELNIGISQGTLQLIGKGLWVDEFLTHEFYDLSQVEKISMPEKSIVELVIEVEPVIEVEEEPEEEPAVEDERLLGLRDENVDFSIDQILDVEMFDSKETASDQLQPVLEKVDAAVDNIDDITDQADLDEPTLPAPDEIEAANRALDRLQVGGWVMLTQGAFDVSPDVDIKLKLAVVVKGGSKYIFVNRLGIKQLDIEKEQFAVAIATGEMSIVDNGVQFSSALEKVVRNMQSKNR